jgi:heme exporter protein B
MKKYFRHVGIIAWKDILLEFKTKEMLISMFMLAVLILIIFIFSIHLGKIKAIDVAPGVLWIAIIFSGTIGLNRSFLNEKENDCLLGIMSTPIDRSAIYFGKMISNFFFMSIMEIFIFPVFIVFFNLPVQNFQGILLITFLGTLGFTACGTLLSTMSVASAKLRYMLPVLLYPLILPVVIAAVHSTGALLYGKQLSDIAHWLKLLISFDIIFMTAAFLLFEYTLEG